MPERGDSSDHRRGDRLTGKCAHETPDAHKSQGSTNLISFQRCLNAALPTGGCAPSHLETAVLERLHALAAAIIQDWPGGCSKEGRAASSATTPPRSPRGKTTREQGCNNRGDGKPRPGAIKNSKDMHHHGRLWVSKPSLTASIADALGAGQESFQ